MRFDWYNAETGYRPLGVRVPSIADLHATMRSLSERERDYIRADRSDNWRLKDALAALPPAIPAIRREELGSIAWRLRDLADRKQCALQLQRKPGRLAKLPEGRPADRLADKRHWAFLQAANSCNVHWPRDRKYQHIEWSDRIYVAPSCQTRIAINDGGIEEFQGHAVLPRNWLKQVEDLGATKYGKNLVLLAQPLVDEKDRDGRRLHGVFQCETVRPGRGYSVSKPETIFVCQWRGVEDEHSPPEPRRDGTIQTVMHVTVHKTRAEALAQPAPPETAIMSIIEGRLAAERADAEERASETVFEDDPMKGADFLCDLDAMAGLFDEPVRDMTADVAELASFTPAEPAPARSRAF